MTSPVEQIVVECPKCGLSYDDWTRGSVNLREVVMQDQDRPTGNLTPREFAFLTPEDMGSDYEAACRGAGLAVTEQGWGFLLCEDEQGSHWSAITDDPEYLRQLIGASEGVLDGLAIPPDMYDRTRRGWPDEWREGDDAR
jgi:hypothetical protein